MSDRNSRRVPITLYPDSELAERIERLAASEERSVSWTACRIIQNALAEPREARDGLKG
jgi:hypothetical protein